MDSHIEKISNIVGPGDLVTNEDAIPYAKDYTKQFTIKPLAVAFPRTAEKVQRIVKYCFEHSLAIVPSGGRTGLVGAANACNNELVISLSKMSTVNPVNKLEKTIYCEPGVTTKEIQGRAQNAGLYFPIDLASSGSSQIG